jgi:Domain of unknown function (DUF4249)
MKNIFILFLLSACLFAACDKETSLTKAPNKAVVQAFLSPNRIAEVKITKEIPFSTDTITTLEVLKNLKVKLIANGKSYPLTFKDSVYVSDFLIQQTGTYRLEFDYNGKTITAETNIPNKPTNFKGSVKDLYVAPFAPGGGGFGGGGGFANLPDPVRLNWDNTEADYHVLVVQNTELASDPINNNTNRPRRIFRFQPTQSTNSEISPRRFEYYGKHNLILYRLKPEYALLYRDNGATSLNLTTPFSNVQNGLGIFTGVSADTVFVTVRKP